MVLSLQRRCIYGPVSSRRLGRSLGLNLLPVENKVCMFDCVYCHYGATDVHAFGPEISYPDVSLVAGELEQTLRTCAARHEHLDAITFSGNGEPTLHPRFGGIVDEVMALRDRFTPGLPVTILSNSTTAGRPEIRAALHRLDRRIMKLDAGTEAAFAAVNHPHPSIRLEELIEGLSILERITIQTAFMKGSVDNSTPKDIDAWMEAVARIHPMDIQIYTIDRPSADGFLHKVDRPDLERIAAEVVRRTGIPARVF